MTSSSLLLPIFAAAITFHVILTAPVDVKPKAKGSEEVVFYGNHQNAPRVKKSDLEPENHEIASAVDDHIAAILEDKVKQDDAANENASQVTLSKGSEENAISSQSKSEEDEENSYESQLEQFSDKNDAYTDPEAEYFPYFSPYKRRRRNVQALTAEEMLVSNDLLAQRQKRNVNVKPLTAENMVPDSSVANRVRRNTFHPALTAEDMMMTSTADKKIQRVKRNVYDSSSEDSDEDDDYDDSSYYGRSRDNDIYDDLNDDEKVWLLRYIENNPQMVDLLSQYGNEERERQEEYEERAREEEEEEKEEIKEALRYLDQLAAYRKQISEQEDNDDPEVEYEPIVYHGEPGIFIPLPNDASEVEKRSGYGSYREDPYDRWQEIAEEEAEKEKEEEEYEEAYDKLIELAQALRQHDSDK